MQTLISKLQYHYFEKGEFTDASVTIEQERNEFLKIGMYHNGAFLLYFINEENQTFSHVAKNLSDFNSFISDFFEQKLEGSKLNNQCEWLAQRKQYFITRNFEYRPEPTRHLGLLIEPLFFLIIFSVFSWKQDVALRYSVFIFYLLLYGSVWLLFARYYFFTKHLYLKISRGSDDFCFGKNDEKKKYSKKDILQITFYHNKVSKIPWSGFYTYQIDMKDGTVLKLTNLLIGNFVLGEKFPNVIINDKYKFFPFVKRARSKTADIYPVAVSSIVENCYKCNFFTQVLLFHNGNPQRALASVLKNR